MGPGARTGEGWRFTRRDAVAAVAGATLVLVVMLPLTLCRRGDDLSPARPPSVDAARQPTRAAPPAPLPPLALEGPPPVAPDAPWPDARAATALDAAGLWAWTRKATASQDDRDWNRLATLVRAVRSRGVHEQVWNALWARLEHAEELGADRQLTLDEAAILARACKLATGDRSYEVRVQEYARSQDRAGTKRRFAEDRLAEARKAWTEHKDAGLCRARLDAARAAAQKLPAAETADLLTAIDALEVQLPPRPPR